MKTRWLLLLGSLWLWNACLTPTQEGAAALYQDVGDIPFDSLMGDDDAFRLCNASRVFQYYNFSQSLQFEGEKLGLWNYFREAYQVEGDSAANGYLTIRFIVNCEGESGRFRIKGMDEDYQPFQFSRAIQSQLLRLTQDLRGWKIAYHRDRPRDYYQYLTFKLQQGQLIEILP